MAFRHDGLFRLIVRVDGEIGKEVPFLVSYGSAIRESIEAALER